MSLEEGSIELPSMRSKLLKLFEIFNHNLKKYFMQSDTPIEVLSQNFGTIFVAQLVFSKQDSIPASYSNTHSSW